MDLGPNVISDDQLLELMRECWAEIGKRSKEAQALARSMQLTVKEEMELWNKSAAAEIERLREEEIQRVERAAKAAVRQKTSSSGAVPSSEVDVQKEFLSKVCAILRPSNPSLVPHNMCIVLARTKKGQRVIINEGVDPFRPDHLGDWYVGSPSVIVGAGVNHLAKAELTVFCEEFFDYYNGLATTITGKIFGIAAPQTNKTTGKQAAPFTPDPSGVFKPQGVRAGRAPGPSHPSTWNNPSWNNPL